MKRAQAVGLLSVVLAAACARPAPALYASSAEDPAYAERYPLGLAGARTRFAADEQQVRLIAAEFPKYPDELSKPAWATVGTVVETADEAGKGGDLATGMAESDAVRTFYDQEKETIRQRVGGAADYAAKQKQCDVEFYGPVGGALDRSIDQQLEKRLRAHNGAQRIIEDHEDALGKPNVEKLQKQADQIALASYLVHVRMPQAKRDLEAALADASDVKKTLAHSSEQAKAVQNDARASKADKQTAEKRAAAAASASAALDNEVAQARALADEMDKRVSTAQGEYEKALETLEKTLKARADAEPTK